MEATVPFKAAYTLLAKNEETFDKDYSDEAKSIIEELSKIGNIDVNILYKELKNIDFFVKNSKLLDLE